MIRAFWIVGLSITTLMFSGMTLICLVALIEKRHLNGTGWSMLFLGAYGTWFIFARLRSAIKYGDPTRGMEPVEKPRTFYDYIDDDTRPR